MSAFRQGSFGRTLGLGSSGNQTPPPAQTTPPSTSPPNMGSYRIVNCPNQELAKTNMAFVAPGDPVARIGYLEAGSCVFTVKEDPAVEPGGLGLNSIQRKTLRVSLGDQLSAQPFQPPRDGFAAVMLQVNVDFISKRAASAKVELDAPQLIAHLTSRYAGQVFALEQTLAFEYQGTNFLLTIRNLLVLDKAGEQVGVSRGQLVPTSAWLFETASGVPGETDYALQRCKLCMCIPACCVEEGPRRKSGSGLKVVGQRTVVAPQLFKHKEFNFEKLGIGGLDMQFEQIFRRAFASRVFPPAVVERLGIRHVKGVLLFGPPGTGKTLIARQIGKMLNGKDPKVVNGPEILNKYVGASEENVRKLFEEAEADQQRNGDAAELHVIIFDEIDAICKSRGSVRDGSGVHDTVVNQLLTKIDGVDALNNILLIGMTNRKDMLDEALLRPGRLEVQVEIGLPDDKGRLQILKIHTGKMAQNSFLAQDVDLWSLAERTKNFSGAEIEGLVKSATSFALNRQVDVNDLSKPIDEENLKVAMQDFDRALTEVKPAFGAVTETLEQHRLNGMIDSGESYRKLLSSCRTFVEQVRNSEQTPLLTCLLHGPPGTGKTALAATVGIESQFPFVKVISSEAMVGYSELAKSSQIAKTFDDAYRSSMSIIILDDIERLLEYVAIGPRFSNGILQTLLVLLKKQPPSGRKLLVLGTTNAKSVMEDMDITSVFDVKLSVPQLRPSEIKAVLHMIGAFAPQDMDLAVASLPEETVPMKKLLLWVDMARQGLPEGSPIPVARLQQIIASIER